MTLMKLALSLLGTVGLTAGTLLAVAEPSPEPLPETNLPAACSSCKTTSATCKKSKCGSSRCLTSKACDITASANAACEAAACAQKSLSAQNTEPVSTTSACSEKPCAKSACATETYAKKTGSKAACSKEKCETQVSLNKKCAGTSSCEKTQAKACKADAKVSVCAKQVSTCEKKVSACGKNACQVQPVSTTACEKSACAKTKCTEAVSTKADCSGSTCEKVASKKAECSTAKCTEAVSKDACKSKTCAQSTEPVSTTSACSKEKCKTQVSLNTKCAGTSTCEKTQAKTCDKVCEADTKVSVCEKKDSACGKNSCQVQSVSTTACEKSVCTKGKCTEAVSTKADCDTQASCATSKACATSSCTVETAAASQCCDSKCCNDCEGDCAACPGKAKGDCNTRSDGKAKGDCANDDIVLNIESYPGMIVGVGVNSNSGIVGKHVFTVTVKSGTREVEQGDVLVTACEAKPACVTRTCVTQCPPVSHCPTACALAKNAEPVANRCASCEDCICVKCNCDDDSRGNRPGFARVGGFPFETLMPAVVPPMHWSMIALEQSGRLPFHPLHELPTPRVHHDARQPFLPGGEHSLRFRIDPRSPQSRRPHHPAADRSPHAFAEPGQMMDRRDFAMSSFGTPVSAKRPVQRPEQPSAAATVEGTWSRTHGDMILTFTCRNGRLEGTCHAAGGKVLEFSGTCSVSADDQIFGLIDNLEVPGIPGAFTSWLVDQPFAVRFRAADTGLVLKDFRCADLPTTVEHLGETYTVADTVRAVVCGRFTRDAAN